MARRHTPSGVDVHAPVQPRRASRGAAPFLIAASALCGMAAVGGALATMRPPSPVVDLSSAQPPPVVANARAPALPDISPAVAAAAERVREAAGDGDDPLATLYVALTTDGRVADAEVVAEVLDLDPSDPDLCAARVAHHSWQREFRSARALAWRCVRAHPDQRARFLDAWFDAHADDPDFIEPVVTWVPGIHATSFGSMNRSSSVIFRVFQDGETLGVFKPNQDVPHTNYRGELATYRLCALIHCDVRVPYNHEVRITADHLAELMGERSIERSPVLNGSRGDARWYTDPDDTRWMYGTYKSWLDGIVMLELEEYDVWRPLLALDADIDALRNTPMEDALEDMPRIHRMARTGARTSAADVAHQLSDLHVLDALVGNFDRFHDHAPGLNIHWYEGAVLSLDNGAAFLSDPDVAWDDPFAYLEHVKRFSRDTIDALRWLDTDRAFRVLLPENPLYDDDARRWALFLERRERVLAYVDGLIAEHGEDVVLAFP